jgi:hypothetical protein
VKKNFLFSLLSLFRIHNSVRDGYAPYADPKCNLAYNQLFGDKVSAYRRDLKEKARGVWPSLITEEPYADGLRAVAGDKSQESRARLLAHTRLRAASQEVAVASEAGPMSRELLGVVVEVRLPDGLDVLAAYQDGSVRYIHHREAVLVFEPAPVEWQPTILRLFSASQQAVDQIGPWQQPRAAPPTEGMIRMSFLVSDGLYFGQGLLHIMDKDELAGPIIATSTELLKLVTKS